jgi:hypothetical protein
MAAIDLITNARARIALPSAQGAGTSDDTAINTLITACSRAIMRYCRRAFVVDTFDELYSGRGERQLFLRNFPIQSVQSFSDWSCRAELRAKQHFRPRMAPRPGAKRRGAEGSPTSASSRSRAGAR